MNDALNIVKSLSDVKVTSLIRQLYQNIFKAISYQEMLDKLPSSVNNIDTLRNLDQEIIKKKLNSENSVALAKQALTAFAKDEQLSQLLINAWEEIKDHDKLFIETILAVGLVVNVTLFMATSDIEYKDGKFSFRKEKASAEILKPIMEPITELVKKMSLGS